MAGEFPDVNAERYNKRAKTAAENSAALKLKNGFGFGVSRVRPPTRFAGAGTSVKPHSAQHGPPTSRGLPMTAHCGHAC